MRAHSSNNFTTDDLREIVRQCKEHGIKTYLTVNTVIYDKDIELMHQIVDTAKEVGVSAIIASDVAVMMYARTIGVEVHLSTQLNISNIDALKFYSQFADVSVLARELNMDQVKHIHEEIIRQNITGPGGKLIRLEMFCHGALCMAVSGKCYLSLHEHNRSANRGECLFLIPEFEASRVGLYPGSWVLKQCLFSRHLTGLHGLPLRNAAVRTSRVESCH